MDVTTDKGSQTDGRDEALSLSPGDSAPIRDATDIVVDDIPAPLIAVGDFQGPIEALLRMVESHKLAINDVTLATVTDDYIAYIQTLPEGSYHTITHFLSIASTLLLLKSKSLLPDIDFTDEEQESIEELQERLRIYQAYESYASEIVGPLLKRRSMYARPYKIRRSVIFSPDSNQMKVPVLHEILQEILQKVPQKPPIPEVRIRTAVHIQEMMEKLRERIMQGGRVSLKVFSKPGVDNPTNKEKKVYAVVSFLAMLEMVKGGLMRAVQHETFDDVLMQPQRQANMV